jgi:hypothetical protein
LLPRWNLVTKIAAITGVFGVAAGVLSQLANIGESVHKLSPFLFGTPASISIRDVRPGDSIFLHADPLRPAFISVNVELVVINKGDRAATNCKGGLSFSTHAGDFHYVSSTIKLNDEVASTVKSTLNIEGHNAESRVEFGFFVPTNDFGKDAYFRVLCDRIVIEPVVIKLLEPFGRQF